MNKLNKCNVGDVICWLEYDYEINRWDTIIGSVYEIGEAGSCKYGDIESYRCDNMIYDPEMSYVPNGLVLQYEAWPIAHYNLSILYRDILNNTITLTLKQLQEIAKIVGQDEELISDFGNVEVRR
jgi:hypothetical protein